MRRVKVYLVGAGPGGPGLITARGLEILRQADVIIYDYLVDTRLLEEAKEGAELICCDKLGRKTYSNARLRLELRRASAGAEASADGFLIRQDKINSLIVKKAKEGRKVIRLKNGDPFIFGRASQEIEGLIRNRIEFEVVPGVTAATAVSCLTGIPLTDRRFASSVILVTGHEDPAKHKSYIDWEKVAGSGTVVLYMAVENLPRIVDAMIKAKRSKSTPCAIVSNAGLPAQRIVRGRLRDIVARSNKERIKAPAIVIIGEVAGLEKNFNWLKKNKRILFTGLSKERFFEKATYFHLPLIRIKPLEDYREFDRYLMNIKDFDWIVFCSRFGVHYFFQRLKAIGSDARVLCNIKIAAIGSSTKNRLLDFGILADLVPKKECSEGLLSEFKKIDVGGKRIFSPRSDISDKGLSLDLQRLGAEVSSSWAYRNVMPEDLPDLDLNKFSEIIFSSPSTVRNFKKRYKAVPKKVKISCIGDVTLREAKRCRLLD